MLLASSSNSFFHIFSTQIIRPVTQTSKEMSHFFCLHERVNTHTSPFSRKGPTCQAADDSGYLLVLRTWWIFQPWEPHEHFVMNVSTPVCFCGLNRWLESISHISFCWNETDSHAPRLFHDVTGSTINRDFFFLQVCFMSIHVNSFWCQWRLLMT